MTNILRSIYHSIPLLPKTLILLAVLFLGSCAKDSDVAPNSATTGGTIGTTRIYGTVKDRSGTALAGAAVIAGGQITYTDGNGLFLLNSVTSDARCYVRATKDGFFPGSAGTIAELGGTTRIAITLVPNTPQFTFTGGAGYAAILNNGAGVTFSASSIATAQGLPYSGTVHAAIVHLDPDDTDLGALVPGGDLIGSDATGERQLTSYGMLMVHLTDDNGQELSLVPGYTAEVTFPLAASQTGTAPSSMPLWHYNEATGIWEEEGSAMLVGGAYVGSVAHFSVWNADVPGDRARVYGRVLDCNGDPVQGVRVTIGQTNAVTDAQGAYQRYVPAGLPFSIQVSEPSLGLQSAVVPVSPLTNEEMLTIPDISVACPGYISLTIGCTTGGLTWGTLHADWGSGDLLTVYSATGVYRIASPTNGGTAEITVLRPDGVTLTQNVALPTAPGQTVSAGTFDVCPPGSSGSFNGGFTLDGDGSSNAQFTLTANSLTAYASYSITDDGTTGFITGSATTAIFFGSPGNSVGTWSVVDGDGDGFVGLTANGYTYTSFNAVFALTSYGPVGGAITGTFSGQFVRFDQVTLDTYSVNVTNGTFSVMRAPDEP